MSTDHFSIPDESREVAISSRYRIGRDGTFWSCNLRGGNLRKIGPWYQIHGVPDSNGYLSANIRDESTWKIVKVRFHQLVMAAFGPPCPIGFEVCHKDDDRANNRFENLYYGTHADNMRDRQRNGKGNFGLPGEMGKRAKLTSAQVAEIRKQHKAGLGCTAIGRYYGVSRSTIHRIATDRSWCLK